MPPPLVLDTCVLRDRGFWTWLRQYRGDKTLPMVAFMELALHFRNRNKSITWVTEALHRMGVDIQPLAQKYATKAIENITAMDDGEFDYYKDWRDHAIAGHAHTAPLIMVTDNVRDFSFLGDRVMTREDVTRNL